jgi:hypothetical protein
MLIEKRLADMPEQHELDAANSEEQRRQRIAALARLAEQQLYHDVASPQPGTPASLPDMEPSPAHRRSRGALLLGGVALALIVVVLIAGTLAARGVLPLAQSTRAVLPATATPIPMPCANQNVRVSNDFFLAHSEPMIAENPHNPLNLVGASKFFTNPAHYKFQIGTYTSTDGGCTWTDNGLLPGFPANFTISDVTIAFGLHNEVYVAVLYTDNNLDSGVAVVASRDGGLTFGNPVHVFDDPSGRVFSDKPWIAVDQTNGRTRGDIYVAWSYDYGTACGAGNYCHQEVAFARSTDGAASFAPMQLIEGHASYCTNPAPTRDPTSTLCDGALGATPVVEPDGTIAVAYAYEDLVGDTIPTRLLVVTSHDDGLTWSAPSLVATISDVYGYFPPSRYRNVTLPAFACDPATGQLYIAWGSRTAHGADVLFATSRDGGAIWSAPLRVNDDAPGDGAYHFQPQIAVAPDGVVSISFFDTRLDPKHVLIDVYLAQSVDHGASFLPNIRVTSQSWDPAVDAPLDYSGAQFIGDYQGLAADNNYVHPFWNDTRTGSQEIFTDSVPSARPKK